MRSHVHSIAMLIALLSIVPQSLYSQSEPTALAPILVGPYDGKEVVEDNIVWTWFMQSKAGGGSDVFCDLIVVEIMEGQNPEEALRLNPPVVLRENLSTSSWQTSFLARQFENAKRYAWRIVAKVNKLATTSLDKQKIVSASEIWTFVYHDPSVAADKLAVPFVQETKTEATSETTAVTADQREAADNGSEATSPKAIELHGNARFLGVSENRKGNLSQAPPVFQRLQVDPTLKLFGVPIGLNLLITNEQNLNKSDISRGVFGSQNMKKGLNLMLQQRISETISDIERERDSASVDTLRQFASLDSVALESRIASLMQLQDIDLSENLESLREFKLLSPEQEILSQFPAFGFGKVTPRFGNLLFNNTTMNGALLEYNPGYFYVGGSVGKIQRETDIRSIPENILDADTTLFRNALLSSLEFYRNIYSARIGYGRRNANHIIVTGIYSADDDQSLFLQSIINRPTVSIGTKSITVKDSLGNDITREVPDTTVQKNILLSPQTNISLGASTHFVLDSSRLSIDGEFNLSYLQDKANFGVLNKTLNRPEALRNVLKDDSAIIDYNFALKSSYTLSPDATLSAAMRYVGAGFRSVGIVGLRTDVLRADGFYLQTLLDKQLRLRAAASYETAGFRDSVNESQILNARGGCDVRVPGLPVISLDLNFNRQRLLTNKKDLTLGDSLVNWIQQVSVSLTHAHALSSMRWSGFASFAYQGGSSQGLKNSTSDSVGVFQSITLVLNNRLAINSLVTLALTASGSSTTNHPSKFSLVRDSLESVHFEDISRTGNVDLSTLITPINSWQTVIGSMVVFSSKTKGPAIYGAYFSTKVDISDASSIELRFDFRQATATSNLRSGTDDKSVFPVERAGKLIAQFRW